MNRDAMLTLLNADEGRKRFVYDDATGKPIVKGSVVVGNPTIAVGRELSKTGLTDAEIDYLTGNKLDDIERQMDVRWPWWRKLSDPRQRALTSMVYQMGAAGVARFPKFLAALEREDFDGAADEMLESAWANQTPARAQRLAQMVRVG